MDGQTDLAALFREHELRVFTYFCRMVGQRETAADLTQDTFLRALRVAHKFRADSTVSTWLLGIARNVFREWLRRHPDNPPPSASPSVSSEVEQTLDIQRVLGRLRPEYREILVLRFTLDYSGEEVSQLLHLSHDAVRQRVVRAKEAFRKEWES